MAKNEEEEGPKKTPRRTDQVRDGRRTGLRGASCDPGRQTARRSSPTSSRSVASRFRDALDDLRPPGTADLKPLEDRSTRIESRLSALEGVAPRRRPPRRRKHRALVDGGQRRLRPRPPPSARPPGASPPASSSSCRVAFKSPEEFREVMDRIFAMMSEDPDIGPRLRDADVPQRFEFDDVESGASTSARRATASRATCIWEWRDDVDWEPRRCAWTMTSEVANKYFQGKENVPIALARRRIKSGGRPEGGARAHPDRQAASTRRTAALVDARVPAPRRLGGRLR